MLLDPLLQQMETFAAFIAGARWGRREEDHDGHHFQYDSIKNRTTLTLQEKDEKFVQKNEPAIVTRRPPPNGVLLWVEQQPAPYLW